MDIQINIERAVHQLVDEFLAEPYRFFNEAEAVSRFHHLLEADPILNLRVKSRDGIPLSMIHQEYPTFFRFADITRVGGDLGAQPMARLDASRKDQRGQYDIVLLTPEFIKKHSVETIKNREISNERIKHIQPFQAMIEFKLEDRGWNNGKTKGATSELGKLILSRDEADLRYFVGLMRYAAPDENRWNKYWPEVMQAAMANMEIKSIFATHRVAAAHPPHVQSIGDWYVKYEEKKKLPQRQK
jgi:hypothetical protein